MSYTRPEQWHVTVRFLGECDEPDAVAALDAVRFAAAVCTLGPEVTLLGRRVVMVPVRGLDDAAAAVGAATADIGERPDERGFVGHLTVARLRLGTAPDLVGHPISSSFPVGELVLVRSVLGSAGARHEPIHRVEAGE